MNRLRLKFEVFNDIIVKVNFERFCDSINSLGIKFEVFNVINRLTFDVFNDKINLLRMKFEIFNDIINRESFEILNLSLID